MKKITNVYLTGSGKANTITIPIGMARRKGLQGPTAVMVEETENGILVRKLEIA